MREPESDARASLLRSALLYSAFLAGDGAVVYWLIRSGAGGFGYVTLSVVGAVGLLLAYHVAQHALDLNSPFAESGGAVLRRWKRADLIIAWDSYYIAVGRAIFRVQPEDWILLEEGSYVKVVHFPRTLHVVSVHEVRQPPPEEDAGGEE